MSRVEEGDDLIRVVRFYGREHVEFNSTQAETLVRLVDNADHHELALKMRDAFDPFTPSGPMLVFDPDADEKKTLCSTLSDSTSTLDKASRQLLGVLLGDPETD